MSKKNLMHQIQLRLNHINFDRYLTANLSSNKSLLDPTACLVLDTLAVKGSYRFHYQIGLNTKIERVLFTLHQMHLINTTNTYTTNWITLPDRTQYVRCSLTTLGSHYANLIFNRPRLLYFIQALLIYMFKIIPIGILLLTSAILALYMCTHDFFLMLFFGLTTVYDLIDLSKALGISKYNGSRLVFQNRTFSFSKVRFLLFCDDYNIVNFHDAHYIELLCDRFLFNDDQYHKYHSTMPSVAKYDGAPFHHYHYFSYNHYHHDS